MQSRGCARIEETAHIPLSSHFIYSRRPLGWCLALTLNNFCSYALYPINTPCILQCKIGLEYDSLATLCAASSSSHAAIFIKFPLFHREHRTTVCCSRMIHTRNDGYVQTEQMSLR